VIWPDLDGLVIIIESSKREERRGEKMMCVRKILSLLLALPLVFIVGYAGATVNSDLETSYHGALGHLSTADVTDGESGMLEKW